MTAGKTVREMEGAGGLAGGGGQGYHRHGGPREAQGAAFQPQACCPVSWVSWTNVHNPPGLVDGVGDREANAAGTREAFGASAGRVPGGLEAPESTWVPAAAWAHTSLSLSHTPCHNLAMCLGIP